jgi:hypothetical protein
VRESTVVLFFNLRASSLIRSLNYFKTVIPRWWHDLRKNFSRDISEDARR